MNKKIVVLVITLLMLVSLGSTFISRVVAAKPVKPVHKENIKPDDDREIDDDCEKCEQESKAENISKQSCNCQHEDQDNDQEQEDNDE